MQEKLLREFSAYLKNADIVIYAKITPFSVSEVGDKWGIRSFAQEGEHYTKEDWDKALNYWQEYLNSVGM